MFEILVKLKLPENNWRVSKYDFWCILMFQFIAKKILCPLFYVTFGHGHYIMKGNVYLYAS